MALWFENLLETPVEEEDPNVPTEYYGYHERGAFFDYTDPGKKYELPHHRPRWGKFLNLYKKDNTKKK